jgi:large subunit ribosomal protein L23
MALFSSSKSETADEPRSTDDENGNSDTQPEPDKRPDNTSQKDVLVRPLITEKATYLTDDGVYTFVVKDSAHKPNIKQAVKNVYDVGVQKVRTVNLPDKQVTSRHGEDGTKYGKKKAYITLAEGESIDFMD